jgi:hypothetical protein
MDQSLYYYDIDPFAPNSQMKKAAKFLGILAA